jgi:hypothetical protein
MLDSLKRWLASPAEPHVWTEQAAWAQTNHWDLRYVREINGFVIDGRTGAAAWRLEWGPSQRPYIDGNELRLRAELAVPRELQVLVLSRSLMESMERDVFEQYVEGVQTRIDTETPAEMRWLVMFPKMSGSELMGLRERYGALSSFKPWLQQWLASPLRRELSKAPAVAEQPMVLMVARRRLSLRTALAQPDVASLAAWLQVFESALSEAQRVAVDFSNSGAPSTQPSLFSASTMPVESART